MKTMAKHWEEQFDDLMKDGRTGHYRQRLEWFLFRLHAAVWTVESQSDGSKLLIFIDGSVYREESGLDALLALAHGRHPECRRTRGNNYQKRCGKGNGYAGRVQGRT